MHALYNLPVEVYIEYAILDNFCVDFVLLWLVLKCVGAKAKWWKLVLACVLGTAFAVVLPLFSLPVAATIVLKIFVGGLLAFLVLLGQPFVVKLVGFVLLMLFTFALGGMTLGFMFLLTKDPSRTFSGISGAMPVGLLVLAVFLLFRAGCHLVRYIKTRRNMEPFLRDVLLVVDGKKIELTGFLDTGNCLIDSQSGLPVLVVSKKVLKQKLPKDWRENLETGSLPISSKAHFVQAKTATGNDKMLVFGVDSIRVGNQTKKAVVGVSQTDFGGVVKIEALFGAALA